MTAQLFASEWAKCAVIDRLQFCKGAELLIRSAVAHHFFHDFLHTLQRSAREPECRSLKRGSFPREREEVFRESRRPWIICREYAHFLSKTEKFSEIAQQR